MKKIIVLLTLLVLTSCNKDSGDISRPRGYNGGPPTPNSELRTIIVSGGQVIDPNSTLWITSIVAYSGTDIAIKPHGCGIPMWEGNISYPVGGPGECGCTITVVGIGTYRVTRLYTQSYVVWTVP